MYSYYLSDYIYNILSKDKRKLKDLSKWQVIQLMILLFVCILDIVTTILYQLNNTLIFQIVEIVVIACTYLAMIIIIIIDNKRWKENNVNYMEEYKKNHINEYVDRLNELNMNSEKDIIWLIDQSKKYYQDEGEKIKRSNIGSSLICPIFIGYVSFITNKSDIVTATYFIIILLASFSLFIIMYYWIAPIIYKIINKRKIIAKEYEKNLSYILLKLEEKTD